LVLDSLNAAFCAAITVFFISMATVIGPTPPGTGVIQLDLILAVSKSTSPTNLEPDTFVGSEVNLFKNIYKNNSLQVAYMKYLE